MLLLSVELFVNSVEACVLPVGLLVKSGLIVVALASEELVSVSVEFVFDSMDVVSLLLNVESVGFIVVVVVSEACVVPVPPAVPLLVVELLSVELAVEFAVVPVDTEVSEATEFVSFSLAVVLIELVVVNSEELDPLIVELRVDTDEAFVEIWSVTATVVDAGTTVWLFPDVELGSVEVGIVVTTSSVVPFDDVSSDVEL